jgi:hypothetical protein
MELLRDYDYHRITGTPSLVLRPPRILRKINIECTETSTLRSQRRRYQCLDYVASNGRMSNELKRIWKEAAFVNPSTIPTFAWRHWGKPRITSVKISGVSRQTCSVHKLALGSNHGVARSHHQVHWSIMGQAFISTFPFNTTDKSWINLVVCVSVLMFLLGGILLLCSKGGLTGYPLSSFDPWTPDEKICISRLWKS